MSAFLEHANQIFEAATAVSDDASAALTILIHRQGQIHILDTPESAASPLESLQAQHGCGSAFRVTRDYRGTRVEGRQGGNLCLLEAKSPRQAIDRLGLFRDCPVYSMAPHSVAGTLALA